MGFLIHVNYSELQSVLKTVWQICPKTTYIPLLSLPILSSELLTSSVVGAIRASLVADDIPVLPSTGGDLRLQLLQLCLEPHGLTQFNKLT